MQTSGIKTPSPDGAGADTDETRPGPGRNLSPLLAGAATAVAVVGAVLAVIDSDTPLRAPCALLFLLAAPAVAIGAALRGLDPVGRAVTALAGGIVVDMLVAQGMLAVHRWSVRGGVITVGALSLLVLLPALRRARISEKRIRG
ncbi:hypothetical protein ACF073_18195 [Streptomyces sp. NPDC015171]|uniref:hypothetical protein n=1 Tax=Streptomyces sp. NPDC015171 TaxID=3364945 RepID=UPI00370063B2